MENIELVKDQCPLCGGPIPESWAGKNPALGTKCDKCPGEVFELEHVEFHVSERIVEDRAIREYKYRPDPDFTGTRIKVNGDIGTIESTLGDTSDVRFEGDDSLHGKSIHIGYAHLMRIYRKTEAGAEGSPT